MLLAGDAAVAVVAGGGMAAAAGATAVAAVRLVEILLARTCSAPASGPRMPANTRSNQK